MNLLNEKQIGFQPLILEIEVKTEEDYLALKNFINSNKRNAISGINDFEVKILTNHNVRINSGSQKLLTFGEIPKTRESYDSEIRRLSHLAKELKSNKLIIKKIVKRIINCRSSLELPHMISSNIKEKILKI